MKDPEMSLAHKLNYMEISYKNVHRVERSLQSRIRGRLHVLVVEGVAEAVASARWPGDPVLR